MKFSNLILNETTIGEILKDKDRLESFFVDMLQVNKNFLDPLGFFTNEIINDHFGEYGWIFKFQPVKEKKRPNNVRVPMISIYLNDEDKKNRYLSLIVAGISFLHEKYIDLKDLNSIEDLFEVVENFIKEVAVREDIRKSIEKVMIETLEKYTKKVVEFLRQIKMRNIYVSKNSFEPMVSFNFLKVESEIGFKTVTGGFTRTIFPSANYDFQKNELEFIPTLISWFDSEKDGADENHYSSPEEFLTTGFEKWKQAFIRNSQRT